MKVKRFSNFSNLNFPVFFLVDDFCKLYLFL
ncbi:hypothetical protein T01_13353 [Trichinella spiralis]|uniref:Uncharacterized protein n=1 Tax=Trichinella spiralis TaxID=6334 RepID=A0A0V1ALG1_TRISP|nr:hypothetical protein T01_9071 [Trichinella spiralis]KRY25665.1 hypothetical protein T01_13353 [Trichinella spiralis]